MEEKIKIYIQNTILNIILKDIELFEITKKDGSLNVNKFCNMLIFNYFDIYQNNLDKKRKELVTSIKKYTDIDSSSINNILFDISNNRHEVDGIKEKTDFVISLKPTANTVDLIEYIQNNLLFNQSLSGYFRNMISSYATLPRNTREKIIFKSIVDELSKTIKSRNYIYIKLNNKNEYTLRPLCLSSSKDELFNYLIAKCDDDILSFRISRIERIIKINRTFEIEDSTNRIVRKMNKYGPQFSYHNDESEIVVKFSDKGMKMYRRIYLSRPDFIKKEGDLYFFECSHMQAKQYFSRFKGEAIIVQPKELAEEIIREVRYTLSEYERIV